MTLSGGSHRPFHASLPERVCPTNNPRLHNVLNVRWTHYLSYMEDLWAG